MEHVSIMYNVCYLYAEFFFLSPSTPGCGSYPYKSLINMPKRQSIVTKPSSTELAGRSNKRFSSLCVRKAAKRHFHSFPSWCYNQKLYALSCFEFLSCKQTVPEKILSGRKFFALKCCLHPKPSRSWQNLDISHSKHIDVLGPCLFFSPWVVFMKIGCPFWS